MKIYFLLVILFFSVNFSQAGTIHLVPLSGGENPESFFIMRMRVMIA